EVADDRALVLKIVVQPEAFGRQMLANDRHCEIASALASEMRRQRKTKVSGSVGAAPHLAEQRFPLGARLAVVVPVGSRVLAAMVEVLDVLALERLDLAFDEFVELAKLRADVRRNLEVHGDWYNFRTQVGRAASYSATAHPHGSIANTCPFIATPSRRRSRFASAHSRIIANARRSSPSSGGLYPLEVAVTRSLPPASSSPRCSAKRSARKSVATARSQTVTFISVSS